MALSCRSGKGELSVWTRIWYAVWPVPPAVRRVSTTLAGSPLHYSRIRCRVQVVLRDSAMAAFGAYELRDFGAGRKLERFGAFLLDRPSPPAAEHAKAEPALWRQASARFERSGGERGRWRPAAALPAAWTLDCLNFRLELRPTPFGHLGIFPEQFENWCWLQRQVAPGSSAARLEPVRLHGRQHVGGGGGGCQRRACRCRADGREMGPRECRTVGTGGRADSLDRRRRPQIRRPRDPPRQSLRCGHPGSAKLRAWARGRVVENVAAPAAAVASLCGADAGRAGVRPADLP